MSTNIVKNKTVSTRVTSDISERAKCNLAKQGLTTSEYMRLSLIKAANNEVQLLTFEALAAKKEVENGQVKSDWFISRF